MFFIKNLKGEKMVKFDIDKKGYDVEQVENYINNLSIKYEEKLAEQKDRLFTMRNELNMMKNRLEVYQNKDKQIVQENYMIWRLKELIYFMSIGKCY